MLAAKCSVKISPVPEKDTTGNVGARLHRVDAGGKSIRYWTIR